MWCQISVFNSEMKARGHRRKLALNQKIFNDRSCPSGSPPSGSGWTDWKIHLFASKRLLTARHTVPAEARSPGRGDSQMLEREPSNVQLSMVRKPKKRPAAVRPRLWARSPLDALRHSPMWCVLRVTGPILPQSQSEITS